MDDKVVKLKTPQDELREKILKARRDQDTSKWDMADLFWQVKSESAYLHWGYKNFEEYADVELSFQSRNARIYVLMHEIYLVKYYKKLIGKKQGNEKIDAEKRHNKIVEKLKELGWTRSYILLPLIDNSPKDAEKEIAIAIGKTTRELKVYVADKRMIRDGKDPGEKKFPISFSLFAGQKESVDMALDLAKRVSGSEKKGNLISLICQDFVATSMINENISDKSLKLKHLDKFAAMLDLRLIVVDKSTKTVVSGSKLLKQITAK